VAGLEATFTIQAVDQFGFNITQGGDDFAVTINATSSDPPVTPGSSLPLFPTSTAQKNEGLHAVMLCRSVQVTLKDNEDGTYSVSYRGTTATTYTVHAFFQGTNAPLSVDHHAHVESHGPNTICDVRLYEQATTSRAVRGP
jgi:hypothetical protein